MFKVFCASEGAVDLDDGDEAPVVGAGDRDCVCKWVVVAWDL